MLGFSGQLQGKIDSLKSEIDSLNKKYSETASIADYALWEYDISKKTMYLTKKLFGKFSEMNKEIPEYRNQMMEWKIVHPEDTVIFLKYCDSMDNGDSKFCYEYRQITDNNLFRWLRTEGVTVCDNTGNPKRVIGRTIDITIEKEKDEQLIERAHTDFLTKVNSKDNTYNLISSALEKNPEVKCAFLLIDIDDFKNINDSFGHSFGDSVLVKVATILTANINSSSDVVGRLGGDEFCVFLYDISSSDDVVDYYERVKANLIHINLSDDNYLKISVGAVLYPDLANDLEELLSKSDLALYQTKYNSKDNLTFFDSSMTMPEMKDPTSRIRKLETLSAIDNIDLSRTSVFDPGKVKDDLINSYEAFKILNTAYYLISEDYKIMYCSPNLKDVFPSCEKVVLGSPCYETIRKQYAPCSDCPLKNGQNCSIHFAKNYENSEMVYNVTYHRFKNSNGILVCWNDLTDFSERTSILGDYMTGNMSYVAFLIEANKRIKERLTSYRIAYFAITNYYEILKDNSLSLALSIVSKITDYLKSQFNQNELISIANPYEVYTLLADDGSFSKRINSITTGLNEMLRNEYNVEVCIISGSEGIKASDNNAQVVAMNAKKNSGGVQNDV